MPLILGEKMDIFVSYRRNDSQWSAGRINDRLEARFGSDRVFFDTIAIRPGDDFRQVLGERVGACRVLLAVIGPGWLDILESRLENPADFVRIEIAEALRRGIRVVPLLIDGALPPPERRLPDELKALANRQAVTVRADTFRNDVDHLVAFLEEFLGFNMPSPTRTPSISPPKPAPTAPNSSEPILKGRDVWITWTPEGKSAMKAAEVRLKKLGMQVLLDTKQKWHPDWNGLLQHSAEDTQLATAIQRALADIYPVTLRLSAKRSIPNVNISPEN